MKRGSYGLQSIGVYIDQATRSLLGKRGFWNADIIAHWDEIIGQELAQGIRPDKITYPKGKAGAGIVHIRVAGGAFALTAEHKKHILLDRLNTFVGSPIFADIKITQGANLHPKEDVPAPTFKKLSVEQKRRIEQAVAQVKDPELRAALAAYGKDLCLK